jgi:GntR family transcriptional regulator
MFINVGARNLLLQGERQKFLAEQWPRIYATIQRLGLRAEELLEAAATRSIDGLGAAGDKPKP